MIIDHLTCGVPLLDFFICGTTICPLVVGGDRGSKAGEVVGADFFGTNFLFFLFIGGLDCK